MEGMNEVLEQEQEQKEQATSINPLDYVTIPVKEYRKLIRKIEQVKADKKVAEVTAELTNKTEDYRRWWRDEEKKADNLQAQVNELRTNLDLAKAQIQELLNIKEAKDA